MREFKAWFSYARRSTCDATAGTACDATSTNEDKTPPDFAGMPAVKAVKTCDVSCCRRLLFSYSNGIAGSSGSYVASSYAAYKSHYS